MEHSWLTVFWQFTVNSEGTQPYIYMYPFSSKLFSHPGCHRALSRVSSAISRSLLIIHFKYSSVNMSIPNSLTIPYRSLPLATWFSWSQKNLLIFWLPGFCCKTPIYPNSSFNPLKQSFRTLWEVKTWVWSPQNNCWINYNSPLLGFAFFFSVDRLNLLFLYWNLTYNVRLKLVKESIAPVI